MPTAALARADARVDGVLSTFTAALRRTRDGTSSAAVAAGGVLGGAALVAAPMALGMLGLRGCWCGCCGGWLA